MDLVKSFLKDVSKGKYKKGFYKINDLIKSDERFEKTYEWLKEVYLNKGQGFKSIIKDYDLDIGYSFLRRFVEYLGFKIHSNCEANDFLKKRRSDIAKENYKLKNGFFKEGVQEKIHHKSTNRGIQGYYWNVSKQKYVWLRSSWEFIYAKWLNNHKNIIWDVEISEYKLSDNSTYRPDFFIFDNEGDLKKIVEIKGYWKDKEYKVQMLKEEYSLPIVKIDDITPYCEYNINKEINLWKKLRKLGLKQ